MADILRSEDLPASLVSTDMIDTMLAAVNAKAARVAPCLAGTPTAGQLAEARMVLLGVLSRWRDAGTGAVQAQSVGPFSMTMDTRQRSGYTLWPSEIRDLQGICKSADSERSAYTVDFAPPLSGAQRVWTSPDSWVEG